jgi:hypothetical protein
MRYFCCMDSNRPLPEREQPNEQGSEQSSGQPLAEHTLIDIEPSFTPETPTNNQETPAGHATSAEFSESDRRRTMNLSIIEGFPAMFFINWTSGSVLAGLAIVLGANAQQIALLTAMPLLGQVASPVVAWLMARAGARKPLAVATAFLGRS